MIEEFEKRREELIQAEKEAWANLNVLIGRGAELDFVINELKKEKDEKTEDDKNK